MLWIWSGFGVLVIALLALDLGVFHRKAHEIGVREAIGWTALWIAVGLLFSVAIYFIYEKELFGIALPQEDLEGLVTGKGAKAVSLYLTGYLLEKSLSIDNIFVMAVVFTRFGIPRLSQHRVLYWGILGAVVMRAAMIFGGVWLLSRFEWLFYVFGAYLVFAGVKMLVSHSDDGDLADKWYIRWLQKVLPVATECEENRFFTRRNGKRMVTTLFLVLLVIELADVVFAVDSVPAVLSLTTDPFIVLTSNVFAILGLRSLYFVLAAMMARFAYLNHSLSAILVFIGAKMALHHFYKIPTLVSLAVILGLFLAGVAFSFARTRGKEA